MLNKILINVQKVQGKMSSCSKVTKLKCGRRGQNGP